MGRILLFKNLIEKLKVEPEKGHILLGERDYLQDDRSGNIYDLVFHLTDGLNIVNYEDGVSLRIPVLKSHGSEREALEEIAKIYQTNLKNERFCVNCFSPRFYQVIGQHGSAMEINEEKVKVVDKEQFYYLAGEGKKFEIESRIAKLEEI